MPELQVPMGFFRTAPWLGILAGFVLSVTGPTTWMSRWTPGMLATTHLLLLGCVVMVMMGALAQVLPVLSAGRIAGIERTSVLIRSGLAAGAGSLATALYYHWASMFAVAGALLLVAFGLFLVPAIRALCRRIGGGETVKTIRLAVLCLVVAVGYGVYLASAHMHPAAFGAFRSHTPTHIGFGLVGWMLLLIMAVSFQVLPMFYVAPDYPMWITRGLPPVIVLSLLLELAWLTALAAMIYGATTLLILHRRKRRAPDITVVFWQIGASALVTVAVAHPIWHLRPAWLGPGTELTLAVGFVAGFVLTVVIGMLYKIIPFLVFSHLQRRCLLGTIAIADRIAVVPTMQDVLPASRAKTQLVLHSLVLGTAAAATFAPVVGPFAGIGLILEFGWLAASIRLGGRCHARALSRIGALDAG